MPCVPYRTKACSVVPPKFAGRGPRAFDPANGGEPSRPTDPAMDVQQSSSRATFYRSCTGAHTMAGLLSAAAPSLGFRDRYTYPVIAVFGAIDIKQHHTTPPTVCQPGRRKEADFFCFSQRNGKERKINFERLHKREGRPVRRGIGNLFTLIFAVFFRGNTGHFRLVGLL